MRMVASQWVGRQLAQLKQSQMLRRSRVVRGEQAVGIEGRGRRRWS